mmetsp:Transcript_99392/g.318943  ORF Transcript_99392/g.318943 Transcript_99392/m.318943 type:complete len:261 (-) Transcript_99392:815-1597(-)
MPLDHFLALLDHPPDSPHLLLHPSPIDFVLMLCLSTAAVAQTLLEAIIQLQCEADGQTLALCHRSSLWSLRRLVHRVVNVACIFRRSSRTFGISIGVGKDCPKDSQDLLGDEGQAPLKHGHEVRQMIWMLGEVVLFQVEGVVVQSHHCTSIAVGVTIIGSREDCNGGGHLCRRIRLMKLEALLLDLVGPEDGEQLVVGQKLERAIHAEVVCATTICVVDEALCPGLVSGVRPKEIAQHTRPRGLLHTIQPVDVLEISQVW